MAASAAAGIWPAQSLVLRSSSVTDAEIHYAQIEKEMLSVVRACKKFHNFICVKHSSVQWSQAAGGHLQKVTAENTNGNRVSVYNGMINQVQEKHGHGASRRTIKNSQTKQQKRQTSYSKKSQMSLKANTIVYTVDYYCRLIEVVELKWLCDFFHTTTRALFRPWSVVTAFP